MVLLTVYPINACLSGGHSLALEIQTSLPEAPTTKTYMRGVKAAYVVITWAYPAVAFAGAQTALT